MAKYVYDYGLTDKTSIAVETGSGIKYLDLTVENNKVTMVKVDMGEPDLTASHIPIKAQTEQVIDEPIEVDGKTYRITECPWGIPTG